MSTYTFGLSQIKVGVAAANGTMPSTLEKIGETYEDTCELKQDSADVTEHKEEGNPFPKVRKKQKKVPVLKFSIMNPDPEFLSKYVGGSYTAGSVSSDNIWGYDGTEEVVNKAIQVIAESGMTVNIPNADVEAVVNAEFKAKGIFLVDFTVTPMAVTAGKPIQGTTPYVVA